MGYEEPTQIQKKVIPIAKKGIDIIAGSKSGTGKTATFVLPMLERLNKFVKPNHRVLRGLIIVPTRELADQISVEMTKYGKYLEIRHTKIHGGISKSVQLQKLNTGIDIIIATPGRLKGLIEDKEIELNSINMLVLDEADTMLEMGFIDDIEFIFSRCSRKRQIMMFSATISQNIKKLGKKFLFKPVSIEVSKRRDAVDSINHIAYKIDKKRKVQLLAFLIKQDITKQIMIFVNQKDTASSLTNLLIDEKINVVSMHGDLDYKQRTKNIKAFRSKKAQVLVATDITARGIDIEQLPCVINYELPETTDEFTHRIGRTGRAKHSGDVVTLLTTKDYNKFTKIERHLKLSIKREIIDGFELKDRQPRQKQQKKKTLSQKKKKRDTQH